MAVENLKALAITGLDTVPQVISTTGEGAPAYLLELDSFVTISAAASAASTYRMLRLPTSVKVKSLELETEAQGAGAVNVSVYYSDAPTLGVLDGTPPALAGTIVTGTPGGDQFFASDVSLASALGPTNVINESTNNNLSLRNTPLWKALGLAADPSGYFDIVLVVHTTAITTGTGRTGLKATFTR